MNDDGVLLRPTATRCAQSLRPTPGTFLSFAPTQPEATPRVFHARRAKACRLGSWARRVATRTFADLRSGVQRRRIVAEPACRALRPGPFVPPLDSPLCPSSNSACPASWAPVARTFSALCLMPGRPPWSAARPPPAWGHAIQPPRSSTRRPVRGILSKHAARLRLGRMCSGLKGSGLARPASAGPVPGPGLWQGPSPVGGFQPERRGRASATRVSSISGPSPGRAIEHRPPLALFGAACPTVPIGPAARSSRSASKEFR